MKSNILKINTQHAIILYIELCEIRMFLEKKISSSLIDSQLWEIEDMLQEDVPFFEIYKKIMKFGSNFESIFIPNNVDEEKDEIFDARFSSKICNTLQEEVNNLKKLL